MVLLLACVAPSEVEEKQEITCEYPFTGFIRLVEESVSRGIVLENDGIDGTFAGITGGEVTAEDLDLDGDIDLAFGTTLFPAVFENDGHGHFSEIEGPALGEYHGIYTTHALLDLNGDRLPEIILVQPGYLAMLTNLGGMQFSPPEPLWEATLPYGTLGTIAAGDLDGDGDLDLVLPGIQLWTDLCQRMGNCTEPPPVEAAPTVILRNDEGVFSKVQELIPDSSFHLPMSAVDVVISDRDQDGDLDLLVPSERGFYQDNNFPPNAFYRNDNSKDGLVRWVDDGATVSVAVPMSGMGSAATDLNEDGYLDYCISDTGPIRCFMSDGQGAFYEATAQYGLQTRWQTEGQAWSAWSIEFLDFDNDGWLDVAAAAGAPMGLDHNTVAIYRDAIWQGVEGPGFVEQSEPMGFQNEQNNFGLAAADFDGDGYLEIVVSTSYGTPQFWQNRCGAEGWLEVELEGPPQNRFAYGAQVEVQVGGRRYLQVVENLRGLGQSPARLHFGLGNQDQVDHLRVIWPDGQQTEADDVPARQRLTLSWPG